MTAAERLHDINDNIPPNEIVKVNQNTVFVNGLPLAINGSEVEPHDDSILPPKTANGSSNVFVAGIPANRVGDEDTCGHHRKTGSPNVFIND